MARNRILDFMQTHRFWLFDVIPSLARPFYVLGTPFLGFSNITVPEYTAEVDTIKQLNSMFKKYAYNGGQVSSVTLTRGVRGFDDSMWEWMYRAITGLEVTNRHLLLIHFTNIKLVDINPRISSHALNTIARGDVESPLDGIQLPTDAGLFLPGKAWLLWNCIPVRYKGASDFDAKSGEVSLSELEVQPEAMTEFTLLDPV